MEGCKCLYSTTGFVEKLLLWPPFFNFLILSPSSLLSALFSSRNASLAWSLPLSPIVAFVREIVLQGCRQRMRLSRASLSHPLPVPTQSHPLKPKNKAAKPKKSPSRSQARRAPCLSAHYAQLSTDIKASGLPAKVGFFGGVFYVRVKGGKVPQRTKTAKYNKGDEFVASWNDTVKLCVLIDARAGGCLIAVHRSGLESSKVEVEVYARRFFFSYKIIKKTESKESLADLLEHSETRAFSPLFLALSAEILMTM